MATLERLDKVKQPVAQRNLRLLVTGCARSGTKFTAFLLQRLKINAPHERLGRDGICSWTMAVPCEKRPFGPPTSRVSFEEVFHQVRDPLAVMRSSTTLTADSWEFIHQHIGSPDAAHPIVRAARYWLLWNEAAERMATWRYRVEDLQRDYSEFCDRVSVEPNTALIDSIPRDFNTRKSGRSLHLAEEFYRRLGLNLPSGLRSTLARPREHPALSWETLRALDPVLCEQVQAKAAGYGYPTFSNYDPYEA